MIQDCVTLRWKPGNNMWVGEVLHAKYEAKKSSLSGYTKTHTIFNASLLTSLSETLAYLSKIRSMCSKLQRKLYYQESYNITLPMTKMPRNCSLRFLHYIINLNRIHHVQCIKDGREIDNENKIVFYYLLLDSWNMLRDIVLCVEGLWHAYLWKSHGTMILLVDTVLILDESPTQLVRYLVPQCL